MQDLSKIETLLNGMINYYYCRLSHATKITVKIMIKSDAIVEIKPTNSIFLDDNLKILFVIHSLCFK